MADEQKRSTYTDILENLNKLKPNDPANDFLVRKLKKKAEILFETNQLESYLALGVIAVFRGDPFEMREYYESALDLSDNELNVVYNYAISLANLGFYD